MPPRLAELTGDSTEISGINCRGKELPWPERDSLADVPLFAALYKDRIELYRDMAGQSLHRRGYRSPMHVASLNESAAAGLLGLVGWPKRDAGRAETCLHEC